MRFAEGPLRLLPLNSVLDLPAPFSALFTSPDTLHVEMSLPLCNVALPVPLRTTFTYAIPDALRDSVQPGSRVLVPFRNKSLVGVVVEHVQQAPRGTKIREIAKLMDFLPALTPKLIELGHWITGYYLAPVGEVFRAMLPPVTELRTERQIVLTASGREVADKETAATRALNPQHHAFLSHLRDKGGVMPFASAAKLGLDDAALQRLRRAGFIAIRESMLGRKAKTHRVIAWKGVAGIAEVVQTPALDAKAEHVKAALGARGPLPLAQLLRVAQISRSVVERMLRDGLLESWEERVDPAEDPFDVGYVQPAHELNEEQESAVKETLARGKTAIILVPEIALTLWIGRQCRAWFGARFEGVAVLHSALSDVERAREWWRVRNGEARVVVGTRSAIFAPLENLGLIIVDEEQESSYKQEETPRYHGRDVAIVR